MKCPKNDLEQKQMENIPYASVVWSLIMLKHVQDQILALQLTCLVEKLQRKFYDTYKG